MRILAIILLLSVSAFAQSVGTVFFEASYNTPLGTVATPSFDNDTGSYAVSVTVTITDSTPGAAISYCTSVGADCTPGTSYSSPLSINTNNTHLCANATKSGYTPSATKCATYTITGSSLPFTDSFSGTGLLGASWSVWQATAGTPVRNNGFSANAWGTAAAKLVGVSMPNDQWAEVQANSLATSQQVLILVRLAANSPTDFTGYAAKLPPDGAAITVSKCTNSFSCSWLASCGTVTAGHTYRLTATGGTITLKDNGTQACSATDSSYASGTVGLQVSCSGTCPAVVNFQAD